MNSSDPLCHPDHKPDHYKPHRWHEECGVFGLWAPGPQIADLCYLGLFALQHRGQESAGIIVTNGLHLDEVKGMGLMSEAFRERRPTLDGHAAIGHVRYSTQGASVHCNIQPMLAYAPSGFIGLAHNGNLTNAEDLRKELEKAGGFFRTSSDTEAILNLLALSNGSNIEDHIAGTFHRVQGAYSLIILTPDRLIGLRDPHGYRPLCLGKLREGQYVLASESCALDAVKAELIRDISPGEMVVINKDGQRFRQFGRAPRQSACVFEFIYFARPDSVLDAQSVWQVRFRLGQQLAREFGQKADIVIPVPDTGITAALGFSQTSNLPYMEGLIKNRYVGRSFIMPQQISRETTVEMKLNPVRANLTGQRVVLIDDSIVRGTTSARIVSLVRRAGAKEVHMCVSSPPITHPCYYGIDTSIRKELIAAVKTLAEIKESLGVDSLHYLSKQGLLDQVGDPDNCRSCLACFD
ncbi:MAG: amidophosphoribosyltransferase [Deltaproteobacteria bacterium]|jgi:amidophosphoribosyltransferase|nr:amidophosphoribosyltransferase [Deltaproteobacteria bacterium]